MQETSFQMKKPTPLMDECFPSHKQTLDEAATNTSLSVKHGNNMMMMMKPTKEDQGGVMFRRSRPRRQSAEKPPTTSAEREQQPVYFDFTEVFVWGDDSYGQLGLYH